MTAKQNITVAIDPELLRKARAVAASRGLSVSALLAEELRQLVDEDGAYTRARRRAEALFANPMALGGEPLARDALHERSGFR